MFTTQLGTYSEEDRKRAMDLARQIRGERKSNRHALMSSNSRFGSGFTTSAQPPLPVTAAQESAIKVSSQEDALKLLATQHGSTVKKQQPPRPSQPRTSTVQDERNAYALVKDQLARVRSLLRRHGNPTPVQCGRFLKRLTSNLIATLRFPKPDVRGPVSNAFKACAWEIRHNRSVVGSRPPTGAQLETLLYTLVAFFAKRFGEPGPTKAAVKTQIRGGSRRKGPQKKYHQQHNNGTRRNNNRNRQRKDDAPSESNQGTIKDRNGGEWIQGKGRTNARRHRRRAGQKGGMNVSQRRHVGVRVSQTSGGGGGRRRHRGGVRGEGGRDAGVQRR